MRRRAILSAAVSVLAGSVLLLAGCTQGGAAQGHEMAAQTADHEMGCRLCYDEVVHFQESTGKGLTWTRNSVIKKHRCPDCRSDVTIYDENGTPMIRCDKCAPAGMACSRCNPPRGH